MNDFAQKLIRALRKGREIKPKDNFGGTANENPKATCALGAIAIGLNIAPLDDNYTAAKKLGIPTSRIYSIYDDWEFRRSQNKPLNFETADDAVIDWLSKWDGKSEY